MHTQPILGPTTHAHQQQGHCLPNDLCPSHLQPAPPFSNFHHDECTSFLITPQVAQAHVAEAHVAEKAND